MKVKESGITYKAAKRAFMGNYLIAVGVLAIAVLVFLRFGLGFTFTPASFVEFGGVVLYYVFAMVMVLLVMEPFSEQMIRQYIITNSDIVKIEGIFQKKRDVIPYQSVSEVNVTKSIWGRIFDYGRVEISGFGKSPLVMNHMRKPEEIQRILQRKIESSRGGSQDRRSARGDLEKQDKEQRTE